MVLSGRMACAGPLGGAGCGLGQRLGHGERTALVHGPAPLDGREERGELGAVLANLVVVVVVVVVVWWLGGGNQVTLRDDYQVTRRGGRAPGGLAR